MQYGEPVSDSGQKKRNIEIALFMFIIDGAEGETRTRTDIRPLDPEPSASTSSATSARDLRENASNLTQRLP